MLSVDMLSVIMLSVVMKDITKLAKNSFIALAQGPVL